MTKLEELIPGAANYNVAVRECEDKVIFLRKIVRGGTDRSYGIHVAKLAGLPQPVIQRAREILSHLEEPSNRKNAFDAGKKRISIAKQKNSHKEELQLSLFAHSANQNSTPHYLLEELEKINLDHLNPMQALAKLFEIKQLIAQEKALEKSY